MFLLDDIVLAPFKGIIFIAEKIDELIQKEVSDEGRIKERLMALQLKFEMDEITIEEYDKQEEELLEMIERIRVNKENNQK
ncbi:MAG: gas vesicle protein GvpG [Mariniphaga sp.]